MALIKKHTEQAVEDLPKFSNLEDAIRYFETNENHESRDYAIEEIARFEKGAEYLVSYLSTHNEDKKISTKIASEISKMEPTDLLIEMIMSLLKLKDAYVRNLGISILRNFGSSIKYYIVKFLIGNDRDLRIFAINVLGDVNFAESRDMLIELLENESDVNVAMTAVDYISEIGEMQDIPLLESLKVRFEDVFYAQFAIDSAIKSIRG